MVILNPYGITFDAVGVFGLAFTFYLDPDQHTLPFFATYFPSIVDLLPCWFTSCLNRDHPFKTSANFHDF